jgi:hypothetical protein
MSVQELSTLHQRYVDLSNRFKSAWTFHQFLQGLHKLLMDGDLVQHSAEFQATYGLLKEVSQKISAATTDRARGEMDMVERRLQELTRWLVQEDTKLSPSLLRLFFQRVRNYNESIVVQLVRFYLFSRPLLEWSQDHNDKVDFLVTKLAEEAQGPQGPWILRSRSQTRQTLASLWQLTSQPEVEPGAIASCLEEIQGFRRRLAETGSFDELLEQQLVGKYRQFKFELGGLFFHPDILLAVVETNLELRNHIQQLYRREEQKIVADYQRIFELEQQVPIDHQLDLELASFRDEVEQFERSLENESMSLAELARLREHVRSLIPRLTGIQESNRLFSDTGAMPAARAAPAGLSPAPAAGADVEDEILGEHHRNLMTALAAHDETKSPRLAAVAPDLYPFRVEAREIVAFRRLNGEAATDRELEGLLLWIAAQRVRLQEEGEEIRGILDDTSNTREGPVFQRVRRSLRQADRYLRRLEHEIDQAVLGGSPDEAKELQVLRMRLMREMSGVWLLVYRS